MVMAARIQLMRPEMSLRRGIEVTDPEPHRARTVRILAALSPKVDM